MIIRALFLSLVFLAPGAQAYDGTAMGDFIRDQMAVGEFHQWGTGGSAGTPAANLVYDVIRDPNSEGIGTNDRNVLQFTPNCIWDEGRNELRCNSSGHGTGCLSGRHFRYDSDTNEFTFSGQTSPVPTDPISRSPRNCIHAYGGNTIDQATGISWYHDDGSPNTYLYSYDAAADQGTAQNDGWTLERTNPANSCRGGAGGADNTAFGQLVWVPTSGNFFWYNSYRGASLIDVNGNAVGGCLCALGVCANNVTAEYHGIAHYNPVRDEVIFGAGNAGPRIHIWPVGAPSATVDYGFGPLQIGMNANQAISVVDTITGLLWAYGKQSQGYALYSYDSGANSWSADQGPHPVVNGGTGVFTSAVFVEEYGATLMVASQGVNNTPTLWIHKTSTPTTLPPADQDFQNRCGAAGVQICEGFDDQASRDDFVRGLYPNSVSWDTTQSLSGAGSLKFTLPGNSVAAQGGEWAINFNGCRYPWTLGAQNPPNSCDSTKLYGQGDTFYVQFAIRYNSLRDNFTFNNLSGQAGPKLAILSYGDPSGSSNEARSCGTSDFVLQDNVQRGFFQAYHSCGIYAPFEDTCAGRVNCPSARFQNAASIIYTQRDVHSPGYDVGQGGPGRSDWCTREWGTDHGVPNKIPAGDLPTYIPCKGIPTDEWDTVTLEISIGSTIGQGRICADCVGGTVTGFVNSGFKLWIQDTWGQPSELVADWTGDITLVSTGPDSNGIPQNNIGKIWLNTYITEKDPAQAHGDFEAWYDELIVSDNCINDPGTGAVPPGCTGGAPPLTCPRNFTTADDAAGIKADLENGTCSTYTFQVGQDLSDLGPIVINRNGLDGAPVTLAPSGALGDHPANLSAGSKAIAPAFIWIGDNVEIHDLSFVSSSGTPDSACFDVTAGNSWVFDGNEFQCGGHLVDIQGGGVGVLNNHFNGASGVAGTRREGLLIEGGVNTIRDNEFVGVKGVAVYVLNSGTTSIYGNTIDTRPVQTDCAGAAGDQCAVASDQIRFEGSDAVSIYDNVLLGHRPIDPTAGIGSGLSAAIVSNGGAGGSNFSAADNNVIGACAVGVDPVNCPGAAAIAFGAPVAGSKTNNSFNLNYVYATNLSTPVNLVILENLTLSEIVNNTIRYPDDGVSTHVWLDPGTGDNIYRANLLIGAGGHTATPPAASVGPTVDGSVYVNPVTTFTAAGEVQSFGPYDKSVAMPHLGTCVIEAFPITGPTDFFIPNIVTRSSAPWPRQADQSATIDAQYGLGPDVSHPPGGPINMCKETI